MQLRNNCAELYASVQLRDASNLEQAARGVATFPEDDRLVEVAHACLYCGQSHHPASVARRIVKAPPSRVNQQLVADLQRCSL